MHPGTSQNGPGLTHKPEKALKFLIDQVAAKLAAGPDQAELSHYRFSRSC
ncbi:hypothetical protein [Amycolatopsis circi]|nr:hypothetical protein [Amycolatopsis circi]